MAALTINGMGCIAVTAEVAAFLRSCGEDPARFNRMEWKHGASQWSCGRFLVSKTVADALLATDVILPVTVIFSDPQVPKVGSQPNGTITCNALFQLPHRPIHQRGGDFRGNQTGSDAIYEITLVDQRYFWQGNRIQSTRANTNISLNSDRTKYYTGSMNSGTAWTWTQLVTNLLTSLTAVAVTVPTIAAGAGTPNEYLDDNMSAALMLDRVLASLGMVLLCRWDGAGGAYQIKNLSTATLGSGTGSDSGILNETALGDWIAGGCIYASSTVNGKKWLNAIMPATVYVNFPRQPSTGTDSQSDTDNPKINQWKRLSSTSGKPAGVTGRTGMEAIINDTTWCIGPIGSETNLTALQARADFLAARYFARFTIQILDLTLRGWWNVGMWPGSVAWGYQLKGDIPAPVTLCNTPQNYWGYGMDSDVGPGFTDAHVVGLDGIRTFKSADGGLYISAAGVGKRFTCKISGVDSYTFENGTCSVQKVVSVDDSKTGNDYWVTDGVDFTARLGSAWSASWPAMSGEGNKVTDSGGTLSTTLSGSTPGTCVTNPPPMGEIVTVEGFLNQATPAVMKYTIVGFERGGQAP